MREQVKPCNPEPYARQAGKSCRATLASVAGRGLSGASLYYRIACAEQGCVKAHQAACLP